jgi:streptogramin lyase
MKAVITVGVLLVLASSEAAASDAFLGRVVDREAIPVAGALVTATHRDLRKSTTVYTGATGRFQLPPLEPGAYDLRVRRLGYRDRIEHVALDDGARQVALELQRETDAQELAWQLPASRWLPLVLARLSSDDRREEFVRQCTFCHQQGNWATRVPRSPEDWEKIFKLMARMDGIISADLRRELPAAFNAAYDDRTYLAAFARAPETEVANGAAVGGAVITEWDVGHPASMQHDVVVHPDGSVYSVDTNQDQLYRLDPRTNERVAFDIPRGDSPLGGVFSAAGTLLAPNSNSYVAPHSLQVAPDGAIWVTMCLGNKVGRFDPRTAAWQIFEQEEGLYPHTLRFDHRGRVWYTLAVSNHVGMIDPATGARRTIRLPARDWRQAVTLRIVPWFLWASHYVSLGDPSELSTEGADAPVPYGIDVAADGGIWFSQLNEHRIGRIDPDTFAVRMVETPFPGPRRLRFDSRGQLWIPGFSAGLVARYDVATGDFKSWKLPIEGVETPYALNVDRRTDTVWICGTNSDTLIRFEPASERFTVFPLPTRVTYTREIDFDESGAVWTSNSNFPSWQIEGTGPKIIRLQLHTARDGV